MKRALLILSVLGLVGLSLTAAAHKGKAAAPAPSLDGLQKIWLSFPDCPPTDSCTNGGPLCKDSAACLSDTDLGASKCHLQGGGLFTCTGGQTVHKKAGCRCIIGQGADCPSLGSHLICE